MLNNSEVLRQAQLKMLGILVELDKICNKHNIGYWLDAGTLLGAVRHGGFIPWDDDIDVCMSRSDYEKFIEVCATELDGNKYFLQTTETDRYYLNINIPCKIRLNNTILVEEAEVSQGFYDERSHHGIYIDVFPYDKYSSNEIKRKYIERFISVLFKAKTISYRKKAWGYKNIMARIIGHLLPRTLLIKLGKKIARNVNKKQKYVYGAGVETPFTRAYFNQEEIFPLGSINFEGLSFRCPNKRVEYLEKMFGKNYMQLPPEEERVWHHHSIKL